MQCKDNRNVPLDFSPLHSWNLIFIVEKNGRTELLCAGFDTLGWILKIKCVSDSKHWPKQVTFSMCLWNVSQFEKYQQSLKLVIFVYLKKKKNISNGYDLNNVKPPNSDTHKYAHNIWNCFYFQIDQYGRGRL